MEGWRFVTLLNPFCNQVAKAGLQFLYCNNNNDNSYTASLPTENDELMALYIIVSRINKYYI